MKKNVFKLLMLSAIMSLTFSCEEEFLVEEPQGSIVTLNQLQDAAAVNPEIMISVTKDMISLVICYLAIWHFH
jgi:hypothetical protein